MLQCVLASRLKRVSIHRFYLGLSAWLALPSSAMKLRLIDLKGDEKLVMLPDDVNWWTGRHLMVEAARQFGLPYEGLKLTVVGTDQIVEPLFTLRENRLSDNMVLQLVRVTDEDLGHGPPTHDDDAWPYWCAICGCYMTKEIFKVVPACRRCYLSNKPAVDRIKREREGQSTS